MDVLKYDDRPFSSSKTSNWVARRGGLPPYVRAVARALMRDHGMTESHAIAVGINAVKRWSRSGRVTARGGRPSQVTPKTRAKASAAAAHWAAMKVSKQLLARDPVYKAVDDLWPDISRYLAEAMAQGSPWPTNLS